MQNFKIKRRKMFSLLALATVFFVCFNPSNAFADWLGCMQDEAKNGIFKMIACKVTTTLFDIRKIVYIIGGLGLVTFTFAAIFNKISFKHLANIALSLFLLSMMTPFIEYFTQAEGGKLTYGDFLKPDFTEQDYTMTFGECKGNDCPSSVAATGSAGSESVKTQAINMEKIQPVPITPGKMELSGMVKGLDVKDIKIDPVAVKPADTRTGWQKFRDTIKTVRDESVKAYNTASTVISSAKTVYNAVDMTVKGFEGAEGVSGFIGAGVGAFDNLTSATGAITGAAGTLGTNYFDKEGQESWGEKTSGFFGGLNKGAQEGKDTTQDVGTINGVVNASKDIPNDIKNIFK